MLGAGGGEPGSAVWSGPLEPGSDVAEPDGAGADGPRPAGGLGVLRPRKSGGSAPGRAPTTGRGGTSAGAVGEDRRRRFLRGLRSCGRSFAERCFFWAWPCFAAGLAAASATVRLVPKSAAIATAVIIVTTVLSTITDIGITRHPPPCCFGWASAGDDFAPRTTDMCPGPACQHAARPGPRLEIRGRSGAFAPTQEASQDRRRPRRGEYLRGCRPNAAPPGVPAWQGGPSMTVAD